MAQNDITTAAAATDASKEDKSLKRTKTRGKINFNQLSASQMKQIERISNVGAKIGVDQEKERAAILDAMRDTLDAVFENEENEKLVVDLFTAFARKATTARARRIAKHPACPPAVATAIENRLS
ncbi:hypothetical protein [Pontivivens ytuae]|uniref:Uncharacterized protein n=1 Tax=Pontivivens ytuae TaxID=2789856 RepID=A0A7S9LRY4_9RHOB|nr:hypothetical protein [Pontivivens ytuae]QPH53974.1 hypothetical protein I0K15_19740 [Pontivivens ytuae]